MKAWTWDRYGPPDVLTLQDLPEPALAPDKVLVRVRAASVNPYDWRHLRAAPFLVRLSVGLRRPRPGLILGADVAGVVERVGEEVTGLRPGDEVFGEVPLGAFAESVAASPATLAVKPADLSFEQAAAVSMAAHTALQGLRDVGGIEDGQRVLVIGASGGIGTFAVQLAKAFGADVTGVCGPRGLDLVRSLGADAVDYTSTDFTERTERYDLVLDIAGGRSLRALRRLLLPRGTLVLVGGITSRGGLLGPAAQQVRGFLLSPFVRERVAAVQWKPNTADLRLLATLIEERRLAPVLDRTYPFAALPEALRHLEQGHPVGKIVLTL
ncbi:NADPH:quinone reductase-like Zn-dependent oxidoreductase [Actinocorallia herbida]|uniref:NADPH:quinone reductase-like Zn-dependent oxidoreductase n=1 Tax=Actinocorallia herbida TaxID=58109 RepID=A0A3N1CXX4_9ACTN|nr:NAD(P)-dependent alcohol dehydrogenase [Actinocorallia herbida]ROO86147.1 NADPH:quinone reductase-like Zn-dependent oxidoreductase [Actinocorallia herbida]